MSWALELDDSNDITPKDIKATINGGCVLLAEIEHNFEDHAIVIKID